MKAGQGCWTCKERKIGCDQGLPECNNCLRTHRKCQGYARRLIWPEKVDGRRKQRLPQAPDVLVSNKSISPNYGKQFLNVTFHDFGWGPKQIRSTDIVIPNLVARPRPALSFRPALKDKDGYLLTYYENVISRMISTIDIGNGFRSYILPMAIAARSSASRSLLNALLAVSAFHLLGSETALRYKSTAIRLLSDSLSEADEPRVIQMAACMLLCIYSVFDESDGNWSLHLAGAKSILHNISGNSSDNSQHSFLFTLFLYHDILGTFGEMPISKNIDDHTVDFTLPPAQSEKSVVIGSLGCSLEIMELVQSINRLRSITFNEINAEHLSTIHTYCKTIEWRLKNAQQRIDVMEDIESSNLNETQILNTAELYRLAAYIYLERIYGQKIPTEQPRLNSNIGDSLRGAFQILDKLQLCTSPWPLFIIACEAVTDEHRIKILEVLDTMDNERKIGNVFSMRRIIETLWKQKDLQTCDSAKAQLDWRNLSNTNTTIPYFI